MSKKVFNNETYYGCKGFYIKSTLIDSSFVANIRIPQTIKNIITCTLALTFKALFQAPHNLITEKDIIDNAAMLMPKSLLEKALQYANDYADEPLLANNFIDENTYPYKASFNTFLFTLSILEFIYFELGNLIYDAKAKYSSYMMLLHRNKNLHTFINTLKISPKNQFKQHVQ